MPRQKIVALLSQISHLAFSYIFVRSEALLIIPLMQINDNRTEPSLVSKPHVKVFRNQMPQLFSWPGNNCCVWWCIIMKQNYFVLPILICQSFFIQSLIQIDHLLSIAFSINGFASSVLAAHNRPHLSDHTKHRALSSVHSDLALQSMSMICLELPMIFYA